MRPYLRPVLVGLFLAAAGYALWPLMLENIALIKSTLITIKKYCLSHGWQGYCIYSAILTLILFAGLPLATAAMLLAGVIYGFWEAVALVTLCRLSTAGLSFCVIRHMIATDRPVNKRGRKSPYIVQKFENNPNLGLLLARLSPLPDSVVNYTMPITPIPQTNYLLVSLIGMIPLTVACVWFGHHLGSVSRLVHWLQ